jgi:dienelactone hydrolase
MGGALTVIAATQPGVDAYVAFYGFPPAGAAPLEKITAPGLIIFGENEQYFSVPDAQAFADVQRKRGCERSSPTGRRARSSIIPGWYTGEDAANYAGGARWIISPPPSPRLGRPLKRLNCRRNDGALHCRAYQYACPPSRAPARRAACI